MLPTDAAQGPHVAAHLLGPPLSLLVLLDLLVRRLGLLLCGRGSLGGRREDASPAASPPRAAGGFGISGLGRGLRGLLLGGREALVERSRALARLARRCRPVLARARRRRRGRRDDARGAAVARGRRRRRQLGRVGAAGGAGDLGALELLERLELLQLLERVGVLFEALSRRFGRLLGWGSWRLCLHLELRQLFLDRLGGHRGRESPGIQTVTMATSWAGPGRLQWPWFCASCAAVTTRQYRASWHVMSCSGREHMCQGD
jgi:hypothetical protein